MARPTVRPGEPTTFGDLINARKKVTLTSIIALNPTEGRVPLGDSRLPDRFWVKVRSNPNTGCWEWIGQTSPTGYGVFKFSSKMRRSHRVAYEVLVDLVPDGLVLDHLCRVRNCVNPAHLEPVTQAENVRRGVTPPRKGRELKPRTHCPQGHPYDEANSYVRGNGRRMCRACMRIRKQRNQQARRAAVKGGAR